VQNPQRWNEDGLWKGDYYNLEQIGAAELERRRAEFARQKEIARGVREQTVAA
jgi:hypothetical protein